MIDTILSEFPKYFPEINNMLASGIPVYARVIGLMRIAPFLNRTEVPVMIRAGFAFIFSIMLTMYMKPEVPPDNVSLLYLIAVNFLCGALIGFVINCIVKAIESGGDMINTQMGMQSASMMDPSSSSQVSLVGKLFGILALLIFIEVGGVYWSFNAFLRSFEIFPTYSVFIPLDEMINMPYIITVTSNVLYMGLQMSGPTLIASLGQDVILGFISKTAPHVNVFTMSFLFKPCMGTMILIALMPRIQNIISDFFLSFSHIF